MDSSIAFAVCASSVREQSPLAECTLVLRTLPQRIRKAKSRVWRRIAVRRCLGTCGEQAADGRRGELSQGRLTLGKVIVEQRQLVATFDDAAALEEIQDGQKALPL